MRLAPYEQPGARIRPAMGIDIHFVPGTHGLFVGPIECARHSFAYMADDPQSSFLVVDDLRTALGETEDMVAEAVEKLLAADPSINGFVLGTACQTPFLGIDLDTLCRSLSARFHKGFCHYEANRMSADNTPGPTRKDMPGSDRYHTRRALLGMLEDGPRSTTALALLGTCQLESEILGFADSFGVDAVLSVGDLATYEQFQQLAGARLSIVASLTWTEAAEYLRDRFGIPFIYAPTSYDLDEVDQQYRQILALLDGGEPSAHDGESSAHEAGESPAAVSPLDAVPELAQARAEAVAAIERARRLVGDEPLDLALTYVARPWSLIRTLLRYGFTLGPVGLDWVRVRRVERDDEDAFQWLLEQHPEVIDGAYVLQLRQLGEPDAARPYIRSGLLGKYDKQGRPQGFGSKTQRHFRMPGPSDEQLEADAHRGLLAPGTTADWAQIPQVYGEQQVWGYQAIIRMMAQVEAAHAGQRLAAAPIRPQRPAPTRALMKGLWHDAVPFATDTNGATSVFMDQPVLIIPQDSNGSASTLKRMFNPDDWAGTVMALNLFDTHYVMGNEQDFQDCMADLDARTQQQAVVLVHGPVSRLLGMDLRHRAQLLEQRLGKPVLFLETCGNEFYDKGLARAYQLIWEEFAQPALASTEGWQTGVNLLGLNNIDNPDGSFRKQLLAGAEAEYDAVISVWGCISGPEQWRAAGTATANVVVSASALKLAKTLQAETGVPYHTIDQTNWFDCWADGLTLQGSPRILVVGEQLSSNLLRRLLQRMGAGPVHVAGFFQMNRKLRQPGDVKLADEHALATLAGPDCPYDLVICDGSLARFCSVPVFTLTHLPVCFGHAESQGLSPQWLARLATSWNESPFPTRGGRA